jgi:AsmA protein
MKWIKRIALVLAGLLLLLIAAAGVLIATFDANRYKGLAVDWMARHHQRTLTIDGPVHLSVLPRVAVKLEKVRLSERQRTEEFARVDEAALSVEVWPLLRNEVAVDRVLLSGAHVRYTRNAKGARNIDDLLGADEPAAEQGGAAGSRAAFDVSGVELSNVQLTIHDVPAGVRGDVTLRTLTTGRLASGVETPVAFDLGLDLKEPELRGALRAKTRLRFNADTAAFGLRDLALTYAGAIGASNLDARLTWPQLQVARKAIGGSAWQGEVTLSGAQPLRIELRADAPTGSMERVRVPGIKARMSAGKLAVDVQGELSLQNLEAAQWQLDGAVNGERFDTRGTASFASAVPTIKAQARFASLDLDRLSPSESASAPARPARDTPVDLGMLRKAQGNVSVEVGRLISQPYRLDDARLDATLADGLLRVNTLGARVWGGRFDGSASADARSHRLGLKGAAQGVDMRAALRDLAGKDIVEGAGRITVDVASTGKSVAELKSRLSGQAALQLRDGAIKGVNLARTLRQARAALARPDALLQASQTEKTDFSELSATFAIANGVARSKDLDARSPFLRLSGEGAIDIPRNRIDYTLRATLTEAPQGQGADAQAAGSGGVTVPVKLSGPLEAIDWQVQWSALAQSTLRNKLEDKVRDKLGLGGKDDGAGGGDLKEQLRRLLR